VDELRAQGSRVEIVSPADRAEHMFGVNGMDLSLRGPAARVGFEQGIDLAEPLGAFWRAR
jgi:NTE family protein